MKSLFFKLWHNPLHFLAYLVGAILVFSYLFFSPQSLPQEIPHSDKYGHVLVFFVLGLLLFKATNLRRRTQMLILLSYGVGVECIQHFIPYRSGSFDDVAADAAGFLLFYLLTTSTVIRYKLKSNDS